MPSSYHFWLWKQERLLVLSQPVQHGIVEQTRHADVVVSRLIVGGQIRPHT
jgi:hypothetical protein